MSLEVGISEKQAKQMAELAIKGGCRPVIAKTDEGERVALFSLNNEPFRISYETGIKTKDKIYTLDKIVLDCSSKHFEVFKNKGIIADFNNPIK